MTTHAVITNQASFDTDGADMFALYNFIVIEDGEQTFSGRATVDVGNPDASLTGRLIASVVQVADDNSITVAPEDVIVTVALPGGAWTYVPKSVDQVVTASTTLVDDTDLKFWAAADTNYSWRVRVFYQTTGAADIKTSWSGPAGFDSVGIRRSTIVPGGDTTVDVGVLAAFDVETPHTGPTDGTGEHMVDGMFQNGATAGYVKLRWAQNTASGDTTVRAGSYLEWRVAS